MSYSSNDPFGDQVRRDLDRMQREQEVRWQSRRQDEERTNQEYLYRQRVQKEQDYWDSRRRDSTEAGLPSGGYTTYYTGVSSDGNLVEVLFPLIILMLFFGSFQAIPLYYLTDTWFRYHWTETVALFAIASISTWFARSYNRASLNDPAGRSRLAFFKWSARMLWVVAIFIPMGLSVKTFFFAPPLEVAVRKMNEKSYPLFNPEDFRGTGEDGVRRLLQEISNPEAKLELIVEGLLAIGPSGGEALRTQGTQRLIQEFVNPDADPVVIAKSLRAIGAPPETLRVMGVDRLRKRWQLGKLASNGYPNQDEAVLNCCLVLGEPVFPVLVEMADIKNPSYPIVLEAIAKMETGTPGIEQFTPVVVQHSFEGQMVWSPGLPEILRKHEGDFNWSLQHFTPTTNREEEGRYTALNLIRLFRRTSAFSELRAYERYAMERKHRVTQNLPPVPGRWRY